MASEPKIEDLKHCFPLLELKSVYESRGLDASNERVMLFAIHCPSQETEICLNWLESESDIKDNEWLTIHKREIIEVFINKFNPNDEYALVSLDQDLDDLIAVSFEKKLLRLASEHGSTGVGFLGETIMEF